MADLIVRKTEKLEGTISALPSKAYTHRALVAASLSEGRSVIKDALICDDTMATVQACSLLGSEVKKVKKDFLVDGNSKPVTPEDVIHCRDSGATLRFLTPVCALAEGVTVLTGNEGLRRRPMGPLLVALRQLSVRCYSARDDGRPPVIVFGGGIKGGKASIRGDVSSQFISGLLFALPEAQSDTEIVLTTKLESKPYVKMTMDVLEDHGIKVETSGDFERFLVLAKQSYKPFNRVVPGDYSSAAFLLAAAAVTNSHIRVTNLQRETLQGDRKIVKILDVMGVRLDIGRNYVEVKGVKQKMKGIEVDVRDMPDLAPVIAVLACLSYGKSILNGTRRLRFKESDRIVSISRELRKMGGKIEEDKEKLVIEGTGKLEGVELDSHNDHRIAMACAVAALRAEGSTLIHGIECVKKSYPNFVEDFRYLGGEAHVR
jgi:3-phosphoshikimate 1-carboxyvinyltransferase